jgi:hypothetical protein
MTTPRRRVSLAELLAERADPTNPLISARSSVHYLELEEGPS